MKGKQKIKQIYFKLNTTFSLIEPQKSKKTLRQN